MLLVTGVVVYGALMCLATVFVVSQLMFPKITDEILRGALAAAICILALIGWSAYFVFRRRWRNDLLPVTKSP